MLEITRERKWLQYHTVLDGEEGPPTDLTIFTSIRSQICEKTATRNRHTGIFEYKKVCDVTVASEGNVITQTLERIKTTALQTGDYLIDIVGTTADGDDESLLDPEVIRVINRPTIPA